MSQTDAVSGLGWGPLCNLCYIQGILKAGGSRSSPWATWEGKGTLGERAVHRLPTASQLALQRVAQGPPPTWEPPASVH